MANAAGVEGVEGGGSVRVRGVSGADGSDEVFW